MNSPGVFADLAAQRACWHPVAFATEVADRPVHADLLGEPLVVWRRADGTPRVMSDLCVHRGTALSLGWVKGDELVCAYHGWRYGADGRCVAIPQKEDPAAVPAKARVRAQVIREFEDTIFGQDQVVVESQRPERVPFDLAAELHLRFDAVAVAYRKAMRDLGLAASTPIGITAE